MIAQADTTCNARTFARRLGGHWIGVVPVVPEIHSSTLCCHKNVDTQVSLIGGEPVTGYLLMRVMDELVAIRHTVWRDLSGDLIDITPHEDDRETITFIRVDEITTSAPVIFETLGEGNFSDYYVYGLFDPRDRKPFYVGKGRGKRARQHLYDISREHNRYKDAKIASIRESGYEPYVVYILGGIPCETFAYDLESKVIRFWGRKGYDVEGILSNVALDNRPPNHSGRSYGDIYGDRAAEQIEKRRALQIARGGYGPRQHSEETKAKFRVLNAGVNNGRYGKPVSQETRAKISAANRGQKRPTAKIWSLLAPDGNTYHFRGLENMKKFCQEKGLSFATFHMGYNKGWPPARRGKNVGWTLTAKEIQND